MHERFLPKTHKLNYSIAQAWVDLDDIPSLAKHSRWWSIEKFNAVSFFRQDYLPGDHNLKQAVIDKITNETGQSFQGKVFLLTNLRYWGYCYNPVSFYFCVNEQQQLCFILADINNTPWNQRHCYVHDVFNSMQAQQQETPDQTQERAQEKLSQSGDTGVDTISNTINQPNTINQHSKHSFHFDKVFHVSPFMPMNMFYQWHYQVKHHSILIHMELFDKADEQHLAPLKFYANMALKAEPLNKKSANLLPLKFPFLCAKVLWGIYWNALKLWLKKVPFHDHPETKT